MDIVDRDLGRAERDASPERFPDSFPTDAPKRSEQLHTPQADVAKLQRRDTATSLGSSASSSSASIVREAIGMSRINTQRDLDRHPTELDRIETHRTQHGSTVGRTNTSRKSKKPLPNFGGGKVRRLLTCSLLFRRDLSHDFSRVTGLAPMGFHVRPRTMNADPGISLGLPTKLASTGRICC